MERGRLQNDRTLADGYSDQLCWPSMFASPFFISQPLATGGSEPPTSALPAPAMLPCLRIGYLARAGVQEASIQV